ncbi:F-box domain-containing protein [Mycena sanguinolenta]|uniref:F-box domain-containing protein n=1 Tax=Mycena sanguinolenta TaxID=230812 RepID=A0A8H7CSP2_9AGAR|nr:F-box domain-containing protein [Mycena sanguinolenta]
MAAILVCCNCGAALNTSPSLVSLLKPLPSSPSPDITRLLKTNDAPLDAEISVVRQIISDDEDRLDALDARILHLQTVLAQLVKRRTQTSKHLRKHRSIASPIRRMPQELICEILDLSTARDRAGHEGKPPWRMGWISRSWRQYALGYPPLWSSFTVPASQAYPWGEDWITSQLPRLESQLLRSGTGPLNIHWSRFDRKEPSSRILDLMLPHSNRWRTVSFHKPPRAAVRPGRLISMSFPIRRPTNVELDWLQPLRGKLDALRRLEMVGLRCTTFLDVFATAPNLCKVVGISLPPADEASIEVPWKQIKYYRGTYSFAQQVDILQAAPNLLSCTLDITDYDYTFVPPTDTTITLRQLRRLCLDQLGFHLPIVAPNLEELRCVDGQLKIPQILSFVHRASCTLRRLVLWQCHIHPDLISALRDLPSLTYLFLENEGHLEEHGVALFAALTVSGTAADICPHLATMLYGYTRWDSSASQDSFVCMARSRFLANPSDPLNPRFASLRLLSIDAYESEYVPPKADVEARVRMLQDEGFDVTFLGEGETTEYLDSKED